MAIASILPPARTVFVNSNGTPLSGGTVGFFVPPATNTLKTTWQDAAEATPNANPVVLDGNGSALIYGSGSYYMVVSDVNGNLIWNGVTQDVYGLITASNNTFTGTETFNGAVTFGSTVALGSSATATTQSPGDNTTKVATDAFVTAAVAAATSVPYKAIAGCLITSLTGTNTTASATITSGQAVNSLNTAYITCAGYAWAASNGNAINGTDASSSTLANSTTYHMFLCSGGTGTGTFCSASLTPTFPTGYTTSSRRIGSFTTNGSGAPLAYTSIETYGGATLNYLTTQILDVNVSNLGTSRTLYSLSVPSGVKMQPWIRALSATNGAIIVITSPDETDIAPSQNAAAPLADTGNFGAESYSTVPVTSNTSAQIGARSNTTSVALRIDTRGWMDFRRG